MVDDNRRINNFDFAIYDFLCSLGKFDLADGLMSQKFYSEYNGDNELVAEYLNFFTQSYVNFVIPDKTSGTSTLVDRGDRPESILTRIN